jgi:DNA-binding NarL/FixJ family response regulator
MRSVATRLVIVDDSAAFRTMAGELLAVEGFDVVGTAGDGTSALALVARLRPDVVLLDVALPDAVGFEVAGALTALPCRPRVVLVSSRDWSSLGARVTRSGAVGFLTKSELDGATLTALLDGPR